MTNKIFSNSERVKEPAGSAGRGVAQVRGGRGQGERGRWWGGRAWLDVALFFFIRSRETRAHPGFWRRSKSCSLSTRRKKLFSKTSYATVWFESTPGGRKEVIYLSYSISFFPNMPTEKLCKLWQHQQDKDAQQSSLVLLTLTVVQAWAGECWLSYYALLPPGYYSVCFQWLAVKQTA